MLGKVLAVLFLLAALRSIVRFCRARRISDGLFAAFWLGMLASGFVDSRLFLAVPVVLLVAGTVARGREARSGIDGDESRQEATEKGRPLVLSDPPPTRPIVGTDPLTPGEPSNRDEPTDGNREDEPDPDPDPEELLLRIPEFAEECVTLGAIHKRSLDYSPESLTALDEVITRQWGESPPLFPGVSILQVGCYAGEVIRLNLGGTWIHDGDSAPHLVDIAGGETRAFPINKARKRILEGEGDSLAFFYQALKHVLEKES